MVARRTVFRPLGWILAFFGHSPNTYISTPNFGTYLTKLVGTIRVTKKMSHIDNGPGPCRNYGKTAILHILHNLASCSECKKAIFLNAWQWIVTLSITLRFFFMGSTHPVATYIKSRRRNSKQVVLRNTLLYVSNMSQRS